MAATKCAKMGQPDKSCVNCALGEYILHFWKPPIFINLVLAGQDHTYVLNTQKAFLKIASFITVYLVGVNSQTHTTVT